MYSIQANESGTRSIAVSDENLKTISKYGLFCHLVDSHGIVDEAVLDKLKLNVRSLIAAQEEDCRDLLDLCIDVIYHKNMKAFGLGQLVRLYQRSMDNVGERSDNGSAEGGQTDDGSAESGQVDDGSAGGDDSVQEDGIVGPNEGIETGEEARL